MRRFCLATAALVAATVAAAPAAALSVSANELQARCGDLSHNEIVAQLGSLAEQYEFSVDPAEALEQAVGLICPADAQVSVTPVTGQHPPRPPHTGPRPVPPRHAHPPRPVPPRYAPPPRRVAPHYAHPPRPVAPVIVGRPPRYAPAGAYAGGYGHKHAYGKRRPVPVQSVKGEPYCPEVGSKKFTEINGPDPMTLYPGRYEYCEVGEIPGKPCSGWKCKR